MSIKFHVETYLPKWRHTLGGDLARKTLALEDEGRGRPQRPLLFNQEKVVRRGHSACGRKGRLPQILNPQHLDFSLHGLQNHKRQTRCLWAMAVSLIVSPWTRGEQQSSRLQRTVRRSEADPRHPSFTTRGLKQQQQKSSIQWLSDQTKSGSFNMWEILCGTEIWSASQSQNLRKDSTTTTLWDLIPTGT